jgi:negative regulator of replication initiation
MKTIKIESSLHQLLRKKAAETDRKIGELASSIIRAALLKSIHTTTRHDI